MTRLKIGIIGNGVIARYYLAAIKQNSNIRLVSVCDTNPKKLLEFSDEIGCYTDYHDMLNAGFLDAVIINVSNDQHYQICKDVMNANLHVCCEKPLTTQLSQAKELSEIARINNVVLFTAFHRRYNKNFLELKQKINTKSIAKLTVNYLENITDHIGNDPWYLQPNKCGGGCIIDNGSNAFDIVVNLIGPVAIEKSHIEWDDKIDIRAQITLFSQQTYGVEVNLDWRYKLGEKKDAYIFMEDGQIFYFDMLKDFPEFKSSLFHEYESVLYDFVQKTKQGQCFGEEGLAIAELVENCYSMSTDFPASQGVFDGE